MPNDETKIKMVTLEEANALLPQIRLTLKSLRELRTVILRSSLRGKAWPTLLYGPSPWPTTVRCGLQH